jgi:hypothetical protein
MAWHTETKTTAEPDSLQSLAESICASLDVVNRGHVLLKPSISWKAHRLVSAVRAVLIWA